MGADKKGEFINELIDAEQWEEARAAIESALKKEPRSHWLLTQLGETYYEQKDYKKALEILLQSRDILPDCPLTLWHLAGAFDALGYYPGAIQLYTWLLRSKKTPTDDPCWESDKWTDALKTDCVFRIGLCFKHLGRKESAEHCFRKYLALLSVGAEGSYPIEEVSKHLQDLHKNKRQAVKNELRQAADWLLQTSGEDAALSASPPVLDRQSLQELQGV